MRFSKCYDLPNLLQKFNCIAVNLTLADFNYDKMFRAAVEIE